VNAKFNEHQIFDSYKNLFDLQGGQRILAENPIVCHEFNRMAYFMINPKKHLSKKLIVVPFMHERKIYLNKQKPGNQYFYTVIEEAPEEKVFDDSNNFIKNAGHSKYIISMDIDRQLYYVMSDKGILLNKVDFSEQITKYGNPVQISPNGKNLIF
jgi:hypothetical protein